jgi:Zn-dependent peptidase ImmA (M78 family)
MGRGTKVPITPEVLSWAIRESGRSLDEIAAHLGEDRETVRLWVAGADQPSLTHFRRLAAYLHRPEAALLLPSVPARETPPIEFRRSMSAKRQRLLPAEHEAVREAARLQRALSWVLSQSKWQADLPKFEVRSNPADTASRVRKWLGVPVAVQKGWSTASEAQRAWREALEGHGIVVLFLSMGKDACRGFSLWDDRAPLIASNTHYSQEARIYTLFHELGHLLTRTSSVCAPGGKFTQRETNDPVERWCERFAAALLLPSGSVDRFLENTELEDGAKIDSLDVPSELARTFKVSLRAAVLRLIEKNLAGWDLWDQVPPLSDEKQAVIRRSSEPRFRRKVREDEYGTRPHKVLLDGLESDVIERGDVLRLLDITDSDLDEWRHRLSG